MKKAYLTLVVNNATVESVLDRLQGYVHVLAQGEISISDKKLSTLPKDIWLHQPVVSKGGKLRHVSHGDSAAGRWVTDEELSVLKQYGVCVEFQAAYSGKAPGYTLHMEAAQAEASGYGFDVAEKLKTDFGWADEGTMEEGTERRWLRIAMPAWFHLTE